MKIKPEKTNNETLKQELREAVGALPGGVRERLAAKFEKITFLEPVTDRNIAEDILFENTILRKKLNDLIIVMLKDQCRRASFRG
jgi:hypothetical protein